MLESIFRNLNDIRVFDVFFVEGQDGRPFDSSDILEILEYSFTERFQIEDSMEHLTRMKIFEEVEVPIEVGSGCKICKYTDKMKLPRIGKHKTHAPYEMEELPVIHYRIALNNTTKYLFKALYNNISECIEDD